MKLLNTLATAAVATVIATGAFSQSAFDGSLGVSYIYAPDDTFDYQTQIDGSLVYGISPSFQLQLDLGSTNYEGGSSDLNYGIHAIYSPNEMLDIGVFYSEEVDSYYYAGVEIAYRIGLFDIEAHAENEDDGSYYNIGAQIAYAFDGIGSLPGGLDVYAGFNNQYYDSGEVYIPNIYVGLNVDIRDNLQLNTRAASMDDGDYRYYTVGLTYNFGEGAAFTARDFSSTFPGY